MTEALKDVSNILAIARRIYLHKEGEKKKYDIVPQFK